MQRITKEKNQKWIGIAPFAAFDSKMYPIRFNESSDFKSFLKIILFFSLVAGKPEIESLTKIAQKITNCISVAGKLNLKEELNLIAHLDCMLAMDSGNAHFAAMQQTATITLWGGTHPFAGFAPFNQPTDYCILPNLEKYPNIPCSIYGNKVCKGYENIMRTIAPETVIQKIRRVIKFKFLKRNYENSSFRRNQFNFK